MRKELELLFRKLYQSTRATRHMACSRYEYVKEYERDDSILPNVWIILRVDGKAFHKFSTVHQFEKPNDENALNLMSAAAMIVMQEFRDIIISYGQSDEYSFVFRKETNIFNRRASKLLSYVTSLFSSAYVMNWKNWLPHLELHYPPCFDGRVILYPTDQNLRDYLSWRQADVHVNNLYNTAFWNLVYGGLTNQQAEAELRGTYAADKNELLFTRFGINYNNLPPIYRKGTILLRKRVTASTDNPNTTRQVIIPLHDDLIKDKFWNTHPELLSKYTPNSYELKGVDSLPQLLTMQLNNLKIVKSEESQVDESLG